MKELSCEFVVPGCTTTFTGETEEEIIAQARVHAREDHAIDELSIEFIQELRNRIVERD